MALAKVLYEILGEVSCRFGLQYFEVFLSSIWVVSELAHFNSHIHGNYVVGTMSLLRFYNFNRNVQPVTHLIPLTRSRS